MGTKERRGEDAVVDERRQIPDAGNADGPILEHHPGGTPLILAGTPRSTYMQFCASDDLGFVEEVRWNLSMAAPPMIAPRSQVAA
jgi:hypothetical protein